MEMGIWTGNVPNKVFRATETFVRLTWWFPAQRRRGSLVKTRRLHMFGFPIKTQLTCKSQKEPNKSKNLFPTWVPLNCVKRQHVRTLRIPGTDWKQPNRFIQFCCSLRFSSAKSGQKWRTEDDVKRPWDVQSRSAAWNWVTLQKSGSISAENHSNLGDLSCLSISQSHFCVQSDIKNKYEQSSSSNVAKAAHFLPVRWWVTPSAQTSGVLCWVMFCINTKPTCSQMLCLCRKKKQRCSSLFTWTGQLYADQT